MLISVMGNGPFNSAVRFMKLKWKFLLVITLVHAASQNKDPMGV